MNKAAVREVPKTYRPEPTVLFISKDGRRIVLAVTGPVDQLITEYERAGYPVESRPDLKKAS